MQLRVTNYGGTLARDIRLTWKKPILNYMNEIIKFTNQEGAPDIPVLLPSESVAVVIGTEHDIFSKFKDMNYSGEIYYKNSSGKEEHHPFIVSAENYRNTLSYDEETLKTHYQIQQIPDQIKELTEKVEELKRTIEPEIKRDLIRRSIRTYSCRRRRI